LEALILEHTQGVRPCINNIAKRHTGITTTAFTTSSGTGANTLPYVNFTNVVFSGFGTEYHKPPFNTPELDFVLNPFDDGLFAFPNCTQGYKCNEDVIFVFVDISVPAFTFSTYELVRIEDDGITETPLSSFLSTYKGFLYLTQDQELRVKLINGNTPP